MANKEYELAIKIAGMVEQSLNEACNLTKKQLRAVAKEAAASSRESVSFGDAMNRAGSGIDGLWSGATRAVKTTAEALLAAGAAAGVVGGLVINVGSDFESAFAGVKKTVDATDQQLEDLEEGLRDMAKNMPMTAVELSGIAEAAGQLGIHTENIEDFTKTMADLSVATNLSTDEGASQLAKFANITGMAQDKFENLGSAIVDLGNHMATTEADIVAMGMNLAGAGSQVGMSEAEIMGFAASLSSVGIEAEKGGSALSKLMINMQSSVETGDESLKDFAKVANMSSQEFSRAFKEDAAGAVGAFLSGLGDTDRLGQSAIVTLEDMGMTETRLRDTLLRASNASELFGRSVDMANRAFEENTALAKEADQRYQTFESRLDMVKNRVTDMGITLYQDFRDPLSDCLDVALDFTDSDLFDDSKIEGLSKGFKKSIPTVIRQVDDAKDAFIDFAHPLFEIGDWMIENPDVIAGTLAAIGTTIASLKLAQTVTGVAGAMKGLSLAMASNPLTAAIGLAALAGGTIIGVSTKIKMANAELKKQKLEDSFGSITLSLGELQDAAKQILGEEDLKQLGAAMEELGKVSDIAGDINNSAGMIRKLTWKINMGMTLDEADTGQFEDSINSLIDNSIGLIEQAQYTAHLNVNALFGENDETGQQLIAGFDAMYSDISGEVTELGRQLGDAYNSAMEDGIIDTDEAKVIQELQEQLGRITDQVSQSQLDAKLERIRFEYTGKALDADTFQNLQKEIQDQINEASTAADQSFEYDLSALNVRLKRSQSGDIGVDDAAYLTQEMYDSLEKELEASLSEKHMNLELKGLNFQTQSITDAFSEDIKEVAPNMMEGLNNALNDIINNPEYHFYNWSYDSVSKMLNLDGLDSATKDALGDLWKIMEPQFNDMMAMKKQYEATGKEIPKAISNGISDAETVGILAGSEEALWSAMGNMISNSPELRIMINNLKEEGKYVPETVSDGISDNIGAVEKGIDELYNHAQSYMQSRFGDMKVYGNVNFNMDISKVTTRQSSTANPHGVVVNKHADGGIFDTPHYGVFAEAGPEAFIPLNNTPQSVSIWRQAGEELGVLGGDELPRGVSFAGYSGESHERPITYSPVYQIYGADEETVRKATVDDYERFEKFMEQHKKSKRLSFS